MSNRQTTEIELLAMKAALREADESREEGRRAAVDGKHYLDCPYPESDELNRAGWLDGWSRQKAGK